MENLPQYSEDYDLELVKKIFYEGFRGFKVLVDDKKEKRKVVLFRSRAFEEEYTMYAEHSCMNKISYKEYSFSDEYDNYTFVLAEYQINGKKIEDDFFHESECSLCRGGGCPSCRPSWFI